MTLLALLLTLTLTLPPAPPTDTTTVPAPTPSVRFYPAALYTPSSGVGVGLGLHVKPVVSRHSYVLLTAAPAQHTGRYTVTASTYDLDDARDGRPPALYGTLFGSYAVNGRQWYYGLGPAAQRTNQVQTVLREVQAEVRVGTYITSSLMVQPHVGVWRSQLDGPASVPIGLDPTSARSLRVADARTFTGHIVGVRAVLDTRDRTGLPQRGLQVQLELQRYRSWDAPVLRYHAARLWAFGYVPMPGRAVLALRAMAAGIFDRGDAAIPFYRLPEPGSFVPGIDDFRYYGDQMLALGAEWRQPLANAFELLAVEAVGAVHVASVYSDLPRQFSPTWSFAENLGTDRSRYPLRPIFGFGLRLTSPAKDRVLVGIMARYSPFGFGVGSLGFFHDLRELER